MSSWRCFPFVDSAPRAYRLKASNAAPSSSTSTGTIPTKDLWRSRILKTETAPQSETREYERSSAVVFFRTKEAFGGLSNMAGGFPLSVNGVRIATSEALYQACRFPHRSEVQRLVIEQTSPMTAKMKTKPYRDDTRPDWDRVRVKIMRWCLRVKLA